MSMFKIEDSFEFWYSEKKLCKTFYNPKMFKVVKCLTYSIEVFKTFNPSPKHWLLLSINLVVVMGVRTEY